MLACHGRCAVCISASEDVTYHYLVVRSDLPAGVAAAMVAHAAARSSANRHDDATHVVVLQADRRQLHDLANLLALEADEHGLFPVEVWESDGPYEGELLALGVDPGPRSARKPYFEHLSLYGR